MTFSAADRRFVLVIGIAAMTTAVMALHGCDGPPGPQGDEAIVPASWGPATLVLYAGSSNGVAAGDAQSALDEVSARTNLAAPLALARRDPYCARAFGLDGGNWSTGLAGFAGAVERCRGIPGCTGGVDTHPCTTDEVGRSHLAGFLPTNSGWVFDPTSCRGLSTNTASEMGIVWTSVDGFVATPCNQPPGAVMCCR